ncbi:hypothetical protein AJ79_04831 [Helicocarpus griseus UAMH5409]|uniref:Uncharacterized protein n=1 Tax=Helicocarpus griseus UAMH5409 TaxID=1447875 RepID=A0A2B7XS32_9EURO|nr:hypothetical protein AJ79_04831 [Helicocarpus griseus UAMH5409]
MMRVPYWLTDRPGDSLLPDDGLEEFSGTYDGFLEVFEKEEKSMGEKEPHKPLLPHGLTGIMRKGLTTGSFWFFHALENPKGLFSLFFCHLLPRYGDARNPNLYNVLSPYWHVDAADVIERKLKIKKTTRLSYAKHL